MSNRYKTQIYNIEGNASFATIFIDSHGKDLNTPITTDTNVLAYNFSPAPGIITVNLDDDNTKNVLDILSIVLDEHPATFTDTVKGIGDFIKTNYLKQLDEVDDVTDTDFMLAKKYKKYSCNTIRPIKDKLYTFDKILSPGIYVLAIVNAPVAPVETRLLNLLIKQDLEILNEMFNVVTDDVMNIDSEITMNDICAYFRKLGIANLGIIDLSCRYALNVCETNMQRQMVTEELGAHPRFRTFGRSRKRSRRCHRRRRRKTHHFKR